MANENNGRSVPDLARRHGGANRRLMTVEQFENDARTFATLVQSVTSGERTAPALPDFILTDDIRDKMRRAAELLAGSDIRGAFEMTGDAMAHFRNKRAAHLRNLRLEAEARHKEIIHRGGCKREFEDASRDALVALGAYLEKRPFDIDEATRLFWVVAEAIGAAEKFFADQEADRANKQRRQRQAEEEGRCRAEELQGEKAREAAATVMELFGFPVTVSDEVQSAAA